MSEPIPLIELAALSPSRSIDPDLHQKFVDDVCQGRVGAAHPWSVSDGDTDQNPEMHAIYARRVDLMLSRGHRVDGHETLLEVFEAGRCHSYFVVTGPRNSDDVLSFAWSVALDQDRQIVGLMRTRR